MYHSWRAQYKQSAPTLEVGSQAPSPEVMAEFAEYLAATGNGNIREKLSMYSCISNIERPYAGFQRKTGTAIKSEPRKQVIAVSVFGHSPLLHANHCYSLSRPSLLRKAWYLQPEKRSISFKYRNTSGTYTSCGPAQRII